MCNWYTRYVKKNINNINIIKNTSYNKGKMFVDNS
mgnify:FL=1